MSNVPETYLYEVRPVGRPIVLGHGVEISHSKSVYLTKEDVEKCLNAAYVFRRFGSVEPQRVTTANIDRMHRANFISEAEWNKLADTKATVEEVKAEVIEPEPEPVAEEEKIDDAVVEDAPETDDKAEELTPPEEEIHSEEDTSETEDSAEVEIGESDEEVDSIVTENEENEAIEDGIESLDDAEISEEDEAGVSENSTPQQSQPKQGNYVYKKHNKKNKH